MNYVVRMEKATCRYRSRDGDSVTALNNADLRLRAGEIRFVYGPSGSGKSTLLLCAGALLHPESGTVHVAEHEVYALSSEERSAVRSRYIGFVFQQFHLIPYLSVFENIMAPALAGGSDNLQPRAEALIERFGLTERRNHDPSELSIGERQRVALARAFLKQPPLLLADEPTGNLDAENGQRVMDALNEYAKDGAAVLVVTHDPRWETNESYRMDQGKLTS